MSKSPEELQEEWLQNNKPKIGKCANFCFPLEADKQRSMKSTYENNQHRLISTTAKRAITRKNRRIEDDAISNLSSVGIAPHKFINKKVKLNSGKRILIQKEKLFMVPSTKRIFSKFYCSDGIWRTEKVLERLFNGIIIKPQEFTKVNKPKKDLQLDEMFNEIPNNLFDKELEEELEGIGEEEKKAVWGGIKISDLREKIISEEISPEFAQWKTKMEIEFKSDLISELEETLRLGSYHERREAEEKLKNLYSNRGRILNNNCYHYDQDGLNSIPGIFITNYRLPPIYIHDLYDYTKTKGKFGKMVKIVEEKKPSILKLMNDTFVFPEPKKLIDSEEYDFIISVIKSKIKDQDVFIEFKSFPHFLFDFSLNVAIIVDKETGELYRYNMKTELLIMNILETDATSGKYQVYDKKTIINKGSSGIREIKKEKELRLKKEKELEEFKILFRKYQSLINNSFGYLKLISLTEDFENKKILFNCVPKCHVHDGSEENIVQLSYNQWHSKRDVKYCPVCSRSKKRLEREELELKKFNFLKSEYGIVVDNIKDYNKQILLIEKEEARLRKIKEEEEARLRKIKEEEERKKLEAKQKREKEKREKEIIKEREKESLRRLKYKEKYERKFELYKSMISGYLKLNNAAWISTNNVHRNILISIFKDEVWEFNFLTKQMAIQKVIDYDTLKKIKRIIDFYKTGDCIFYNGAK